MTITDYKGKTLVALSGGADSVALLCMLHEQGNDIEALHCNFQLRGEESERDEHFVTDLCHRLGIPLHVKRFDTQYYAREQGISIEMAARTLRYEWFETMRQQLGAAAIAVAHHREDQAETLLLNLVRGTGLRGLAGMRPRNGHIIRPLLDLSKEEILDYLKRIGQDYMTDSTNLERDALRNRIRLDIMPLLRQLNPKAVEHIAKTAERVAEALPYYTRGVDLSDDLTATTLHERLSGCGFNAAQEAGMLTAIRQKQSGKEFVSPTHQVLIDRGQLVLQDRENKAAQAVKLQMQIKESSNPLEWLKTQDLTPDCAYLDADKVNAPLSLRHPQTGDRFQPYGMGGRSRLVSDFLTDHKLSLFEKQNQWLATMGEDIVWVCRMRPDHRFRVTEKTQRILILSLQDERLHRLPPEAALIAPPRQFTFPFCYEPHPLCQWAAEEVKKEVALHADWQEEIRNGKMLGVLIVGTPNSRPAGDKAIGFLAAFSGTLCRKGTLPYFVPPVFDLHGTYFETEEARISSLPAGEERKRSSQALQQWLFDQFRFLNAKGNEASMCDIFGDKVPPSGTGECCAPKLLQYAYLHGLRPLCMGEFWMGKTPKGEIREEGHFYPSCQHKCKPLLGWMLRGLDVEENPMQRDYDRLVAQFRVVYEDRDIAVVYKPSGLLSVPGKDFLPSVQDLARQRWPQAEGPLIVHRLDMDTSGLMVVALTNQAYHHLQDQFVRHFVKKRYTARLEKVMKIGECGKIDLPLCPNPDDRPRQIVSTEYGRRAITRYEVVGNEGSHAVVHLWPETGRTHQLRVHMAHSQGLANPILGDRLYGHPNGQRLMLFADWIEFEHPTTGAQMKFSTEEE